MLAPMAQPPVRPMSILPDSEMRFVVADCVVTLVVPGGIFVAMIASIFELRDARRNGQKIKAYFDF